MTIETETTFDDVLAFTVFHYKTSPSMRRRIKFGQFGFPIAWILLIVPTAQASPAGTAILWSPLILGWVFLYPKFFMWVIKRQVTKLYREGTNKNMLGKKTVTISPDGLLATSEASEYRVRWNAVERVVKTKDYILFYVSAVSAEIVPRRTFEREEMYNQFYDSAMTFKEKFAA